MLTCVCLHNTQQSTSWGRGRAAEQALQIVAHPVRAVGPAWLCDVGCCFIFIVLIWLFRHFSECAFPRRGLLPQAAPCAEVSRDTGVQMEHSSKSNCQCCACAAPSNLPVLVTLQHCFSQAPHTIVPVKSLTALGSRSVVKCLRGQLAECHGHDLRGALLVVDKAWRVTNCWFSEGCCGCATSNHLKPSYLGGVRSTEAPSGTNRSVRLCCL